MWPNPAESDPVEDWGTVILGVCAWLTASGASPGSIKLRRHHLLRLASHVMPKGPWELTLDDLIGFMASRPHWQPETRKAARSSIRKLYEYGVATGRTTDDPSARLPRIRVPAGVPRPAPEAVLVAAMTDADERGRLILALAAFAGLRRAEIAVVHSDDMLDGHDLVVHGKGGKQRIVPLHPVLIGPLEQRCPGFVFPGAIDGHLSADRVGCIGSELLGPGWTLHKLRHRFATKGATAGSLRAVQELLGHSHLNTTARYTKVFDDALLQAVLAAGPAVA